MKRIITIVFLMLACNIYAETIDVLVKGIYDGKKVGRKTAYKHACIDAYRQAIERAGVKIESKSTVKNSLLEEDYIESQAKAVLLPGFQIEDIGYTADGTYQVVLMGKVSSNAGITLGILVVYSATYSLNNITIDDAPIDNYDYIHMDFRRGKFIDDMHRVDNALFFTHELLIVNLNEGKHILKIGASNQLSLNLIAGKYITVEFGKKSEFPDEAEVTFLEIKGSSPNKLLDSNKERPQELYQRIEKYTGIKMQY